MGGRTYVRMIDDVMATKPNFFASMGYHIFLSMVLRTREHVAPLLSYYETLPNLITTIEKRGALAADLPG